jgi:hypothetical protein
MFRDKINLQRAKNLESIGDITILDPSPEPIPFLGQEGVQWKENYSILQTTHRHIPSGKLLDFLSVKYLIEVEEGLINAETNTYSWRFLYGVENSKIKTQVKDDVEYVYILGNPAYPSLVKIGMTLDDVSRRVKGINNTATVEEWYPIFALPVRRGTAFRIEQSVHGFFKDRRVSSDMGNSREFFTLDPFTAFDKVREVGSVFMVGNPIIYNNLDKKKG